MAFETEVTPPTPDDAPPSRRQGIGLCLFGGGFRAALFHTGAIQRLFELGIATRPDFDTVASVSGGSITSAQWAVAQARPRRTVARPAEATAGPTLNFTQDIARPILALTARDLRTAAMARKYLLPWNWFRGGYAIDSMIAKFEEIFGKSALHPLPERPRFIFCATRGPKGR